MKKIIQMSVFNNILYLLDDKGITYFKENILSKSESIVFKTPYNIDKKIRKIENGMIYFEDSKYFPIPLIIHKEMVGLEKEFTAVGCGFGEHDVWATKDNHFYGSNGVIFQLGGRSFKNKLFPKKLYDYGYNFPLLENENIIKIQKGGAYSIVLTNLNRVFVFGHVCCGNVIEKPSLVSPNFVRRDEKIIDILALSNTYLLLDSNGRIYVNGQYRNNYQDIVDHYVNLKVLKIVGVYDMLLILFKDRLGINRIDNYVIYSNGLRLVQNLNDILHLKSYEYIVDIEVYSVSYDGYCLALTNTGSVIEWRHTNYEMLSNYNFATELII
jgi:hypothetical protein